MVMGFGARKIPVNLECKEKKGFAIPNLLEALPEAGDFATLIEAVEAGDLMGFLQGKGPFTLLVPPMTPSPRSTRMFLASCSPTRIASTTSCATMCRAGARAPVISKDLVPSRRSRGAVFRSVAATACVSTKPTSSFCQSDLTLAFRQVALPNLLY